MSKFSIIEVSEKISSLTGVRAIRDGLLSMIPVLIIGAFALVFMTFPVDAYLNFIGTFLDGFLYNLFNFIYSATFGVLSVYMTFAISRSYMKIKAQSKAVHAGAIFASLISFFILAGVFLGDFGIDKMGPKSMFLAIIAGLLASLLYDKFYNLLNNKKHILFTTGADLSFNRMISTFFPIVIVTIIFGFTNVLIVKIFNVESFSDLYQKTLNWLFSSGEVNFAKGFFFVLLSSVSWFFGIHGSDALEGVMETYFTPGILENMASVEAGLQPTVILTKQFFDIFVLMGGCGTTICLLIAILIFSRNRSRRGLGITASLPMVFNINELMVFGLPIIFNPIMLIPFLLTPLVCYSVAYLAMYLGIVPYTISEVFWTTPVILGGIKATGSFAGALLQLFNIGLGVAIYFPFIKFLDRESSRKYQRNYEEFMKYYKDNEAILQTEEITSMNNIYGAFAKELCAELRHDLTKNINIYYQPQYNYDGSCIGVEALLRWEHPIFGKMYPPLIIKLSSEIGLTEELEEEILSRCLVNYSKLEDKYGKNLKLSINVTGRTVIQSKYIQFVKQLDKEYNFKEKNICLEVTEQDALTINDVTYQYLEEIKALGIHLAIDDFSMGHTSVQYLKHKFFDMIKIDGSLVKGLTTNENCREIVSSIVELATSLQMIVLAEFVETEEEKEILHSIGCDNYQGFLYSEAKVLEN